MKGIIMAGGEGSRLRPLTCNCPKPMMPIMDKPVMEYAVELLKENGITDIGVTLQYLPDDVVSYFGDGKDYGVNMRYFIEETPLGTAGSVKNAEDFLDDTFIVISGDALTDIDLSKAIAYHKSKNSTATLVLKEVPVPLEYGVVVTDEEGRINGFLEKPSWSEVFSDKVNTGIYILEPEIFTYFEKNIKFDFSNDLFPALLKDMKPMYGYVAEGYWCDIGNIEQYIKCHFDILKELVKVKIKGEKYKNGLWVGSNCDISPKAIISEGVYIGENCKICDGAEIGPYTVISKGNIISTNSTIKRSIVLDNCYVGSNCEVRGAILCKKVQLKSNVAIFEEAAVGEETLVGERVIIKPEVKIWPNKRIEAGTIVKNSIIWGGKLSKSLFGKRGISGEVNVDITPEFVAKLGSAYGSIMKSDSKVAISCSCSGAAEMFKYSLATGLLSMGIEVYDLRYTTLGITRHTTSFFGVQGAIHVVIDEDSPQKVNIHFMDGNGLDIDKAMERKIENSFIREDYRRVKADNFKSVNYISDCIEYYSRLLVNKLHIDGIRSQRYKVVVSAKNSTMLKVISSILEQLKVEVVVCNCFMDGVCLGEVVRKNNANLGIGIANEGEEVALVDEKGNFIKSQIYDALNELVILKSTKLKTFVAPVTASATLENIAEMCGVNFIRTKTSQKNILDTYFKYERGASKKEIVEAYLMSIDVISSIMLILNFMASGNQTLSSIVSKIPKYYVKNQDITCPWDMKGKVMRNLIEENICNSVELIEGVKINYEDAWALVLPDADEPLCKLYTEATSSEKLEKLSSELAQKILILTAIAAVE